MATEEKLDIAPFDLLSQKDQWEHLQRFHHTWRRGNITSKSRKADMEEWHGRSHRSDDDTIKTSHTHTATVGAEAGKDMSPIDPTKPLNSTQRKALKDLVDNDFLALKAEINQFADDMARQRREELTLEWSAKGADAQQFKDRAAEILRRCSDDIEALTNEARRKGVELTVHEKYERETKVRIDGLKSAIAAAEAEVEADRRRALNTLERQRLTAQRKVLMSGVNEEALAILDTIPNARDLMLQAAAERTNTPSITV